MNIHIQKKEKRKRVFICLKNVQDSILTIGKQHQTIRVKYGRPVIKIKEYIF